MRANSKNYSYFRDSRPGSGKNSLLSSGLGACLSSGSSSTSSSGSGSGSRLSSSSVSGSGYAKVSFDGFINENYFQINDQEKTLIQNLEISHATTFNPISHKKDTFIGILLKSKYDGIGNRQPIDLSIALDISGSMSIIDKISSKSRITLAKESLKKLISIMDDKNDKLSLITFNNKANKIFGLLNRKEIQKNMLKKIDDITAIGGTNLIGGLNSAINNLNINDKKEKRIVIITDAVYKDTNNKLLNLVINCVEKKNIPITIMAISSESNISLADKLCHFKKCNYFPICNLSELETYLVKNFKYMFFPDCYDIKLTINSEEAQILKCFGGGNELIDEYENKFNDYAPGISNKITYNLGSSFPSELLKLKNDFGIDKLYVKGGLILLKVNPRDFDGVKNLKFEINLGCKSFNNKKYEQKFTYIIDNINNNEMEYFKDNNIKKGLSIYYFTSFLNYLVENENKKNFNTNMMNKKINDLKLLFDSKQYIIDYLIRNFTLEPDNQETNENLSNYIKMIEGRFYGFKNVEAQNYNLSAPPTSY